MGNARTFLINWAMARQNHWHILLRIEDLDGPRIKPWARDQAVQDLQWLGIDWDESVGCQLEDLLPYEQALDYLKQRDLIYPCTCTRKEIKEALSAPHVDDHELRYRGTCQNLAKPQTDKPAAWRVRIPDKPLHWTDAFMGEQTTDVQQQVGDFVVAAKSGLPAYQLAVVVDDARQKVTEVVRGDDLIRSAARQQWLYQFLDVGPLPRYWHLPLVLGEDGHRLAKRHGDSRLSFYREQGISVNRIIGLLAYWSGIGSVRQPMTAPQFCEAFDIGNLPTGPVVFSQEDHTWLHDS